MHGCIVGEHLYDRGKELYKNGNVGIKLQTQQNASLCKSEFPRTILDLLLQIIALYYALTHYASIILASRSIRKLCWNNRQKSLDQENNRLASSPSPRENVIITRGTPFRACAHIENEIFCLCAKKFISIIRE